MSAIALKSLDALPQAPASDVKKLGWRGMMRVIARDGQVVVTNHNKPEAVIVPAAEYARMLELLQQAGEKDRQILDNLRKQFDQRLACLNAPGAGEQLDALFDAPFSFEGQTFTAKAF